MRVEELASDPELGMTLRAGMGSPRLGRSITWCAPTEHMDPTPFLSVNALVLTQGMGLNIRDYRTWAAYVERLAAVPIAALVFGLGAAHRRLPEGLVKACAEHDLPLLELCADVPFVVVMRRVEERLGAERFNELRSGWELADTCARMASGGASLADVLAEVAGTVGGRASITDSAGYELVAAGERGGRRGRTALRMPSTETERFQLRIEGVDTSMLLQPLLGPVAGVLAMQLSYTLSSRSALHSSDALRWFELLLEASPQNRGEVRARAAGLGFDVDAPWQCVQVSAPEGTAWAKLRSVAWRIRAALDAPGRPVRFMEEEGRTTMVLQHAQHRQPRALAELLAGCARDVPEFSICVAAGESLEDLPLSLLLLRRSQAGPGVHCAGQADLQAIVQGLPAAGLESLARRLLGDVLLPSNAALLQTLRSYLRNSGNTGRTCGELFIHRNTLAYRLRRLRELLGVDLEDGEVRATCLLALSVVGAAGGHGAAVRPSPGSPGGTTGPAAVPSGAAPPAGSVPGPRR